MDTLVSIKKDKFKSLLRKYSDSEVVSSKVNTLIDRLKNADVLFEGPSKI